MRRFLALVLMAAAPVTAQAESMTLAERRGQLSALAEKKSAADPAALKGTLVRGGKYSHEAPGTIVIETGRRMLHFVEGGGRTISYPIAVGREGAQWKGTTSVTGKRKNPEWRPTPNMRRRDPKLPEVVRPGPKNPLGVRAIYLAEGYLRIHGTNNPSSIGSAASSGCFRMHNEDVTDLYERVQSGAKVMVLR